MTAVTYIIALILGIMIVSALGYAFFVSGGNFGGILGSQECETAKFNYCNFGVQWDQACGAAPDCSSYGGGGGGGGGGSTTTTMPTTSTTTVPTDCNSACIAQEYTSGTCRTGSSTIGSAALYVSGTTVKDYNGNNVYLHGTQIGDWQNTFTGSAFFTQADVQKIASYGGNIIEVNEIYWKDIEPSQNNYDLSKLSILDNLLAWAQSNKVYCILTFQSLDNPWTSLPSWVAGGADHSTFTLGFYDQSNHAYDNARNAYREYMQYIVKRYKNNDYFLIDFFNEPYNGNTQLGSLNYVQQSANYAHTIEWLDDAIISAGYRSVLFVDHPWVNFYTSSITPIDRSNVVWEIHNYLTPSQAISQWKNGFTSWVNKYVTVFGKPLFVGEYGFIDSSYVYVSNSFPNWQTVLPQMVSYLDGIQIVGRDWHAYAMLNGQYYDLYNYYYGTGNHLFTPSESEWLLQTVLGGASTPSPSQTNLAVIPDGWSLDGSSLSASAVKYTKEKYEKIAYSQSANQFSITGKEGFLAPLEECPVCPESLEWSDCIDNKQTRTVYICDETTYYNCYPLEEIKNCEIPAKGPGLSLPSYILPLIVGIASIPVIAIVILKSGVLTKKLPSALHSCPKCGNLMTAKHKGTFVSEYQCKKCGYKETIAEKIKNNSPFFVIALGLWFIFRVGTKPTRILYPCQRSILTTFSLYSQQLIASATPLIPTWFRSFFTRKNIIIISVIVVLVSGIVLGEQLITGAIEQIQLYEYLNRPPITGFAVASVSPKVVGIHDSDATDATYWNYLNTAYPWDYVDQSVVNNMVSRGVTELTGEVDVGDAWRAIIPNYQSGQYVAIKINMNNVGSRDDSEGYAKTRTQPPYQTIKAVVDGLISIGVPGDHIIIYDVTRAILNKYRDTIPGVIFIDAGSGSLRFSDVHPQFTHDSVIGANIVLALPLVAASHVIDIAQMKAHDSTCNYGVTLTFKNHLGSTSCPPCLHPAGICGNYSTNQNALVDLYKNTNIKDKTRLLIIDGLYGTIRDQYQLPQKYKTFNQDSPNSIWFSFDPVAIDSVVFDYIALEKGVLPHHQYLDDAEAEGLGVQDHSSTHQYTKIQYVNIDLDTAQNCNSYCTGRGYSAGGCSACPGSRYACVGTTCVYNTYSTGTVPLSDCTGNCCCVYTTTSCGSTENECNSRCRLTGCIGVTTTTTIPTTTTVPTCTGNINLNLSPNPANIGSTVTATANALSNCNGKTIYIKDYNGCSGSTICTCTSSSTGCSCTFNAPSATGQYGYYSCIDKNSNGVLDSGEQSSKVILDVRSPTTTTTIPTTTTTTATCVGECLSDSCASYPDCYTASGTCSIGYCCSGTCSCLSGETPITDSCPSGWTCCCS